MDEDDDYYRQQEWLESLYRDFAADVLAGRDELYGEVVNRFTTERLHSYYLANPGVVERAVWTLGKAKLLLPSEPEASLVLAVTAAEVGLRSGLLKPILHGLVHDEALAVIIAELVPDQRNRHFQNLLFSILKEIGALDLHTFKRVVGGRTLWDEMQFVQGRRNAVVHKAEGVSSEDAGLAVEIAALVLESLFPQVLSRLGLLTDVNLRIVGSNR